MLKGHFVFRLPWRQYLAIQLHDKFSMPTDWSYVAWEMLTGKRAADADFMARAWWYEKCQRNSAHVDVWQRVRLLERKCAAQRTEIKRLTKRLGLPQDPKL